MEMAGMIRDEKIEKLTLVKNLLDMFYETEEERVTGWDIPAYKYSIEVEGGYVEIRICFALDEVNSYAFAKVNGVVYSFDIFSVSWSISSDHISFSNNGFGIGFKVIL